MAESEPVRLLRARKPKPARLIPDQDISPERPPLELKLTADALAEPITLLRLGPVDLEAGVTAIAAGARPSAVITGLTERPQFTKAARLALRDLMMPWVPDPLLFKTALDGYRVARYLQGLDYTPGRDEDPYSAEDFTDARFVRQVGRLLMRAQFDVDATGAVMAGAFCMRGLEDGWLPINRQLLRVSARARDELGQLPLIAPVICSLSHVVDVDAQIELVRAFAQPRPEAYLLMLDGLHELSEPRRLAAAVRLALLLQALGVPVLLARAGALRRLFRAFGVRGAEVGLGRLPRFRLSDYRGKSGPGHNPPRFEFRSLLWALPHGLAEAVLACGVLDETTCLCHACSAARVGELENPAPGHNLAVLHSEAPELTGLMPAERVERLRADVRDARWRWADVETEGGIELGPPRHLDRLADAINLGEEWGLLAPPEELARRYRLS